MKVLALICIALIGYASGSKQCKTPLDVVLVVEDSSVLPDNGIEPLQTFVAAIVNYLTIDPQLTPNPYDQAAYVLYNSSTSYVFHLNTWKQTSDAWSAALRQPFSRRVDPPIPIDQALNYVYNTELKVENGERSCYGTVVILVSYSGYKDVNRLGVDPATAAQEAADLTASRNLNNSAALIITVGVGPKRNSKHLQKLASRPELYNDFSDFDDLNEDAGVKIAQQVCAFVPSGNFYPCEMQTVSADIAFVVDISNAFTQELADDIYTFIQKFLAPYTYDHMTGVQAALVTYHKSADIGVKFSDADDLDAFLLKVNSTLQTALACGACRTDNRCIYQALTQVQYGVGVFGPPSSDKPDIRFRPTCAVHYVYVFASGCFNCEDPVPLANMIRSDKSAEIFVVPLQDYTPPGGSAAYPFGFWKEPLEIADDYSHLFEAQANPGVILADYLHKQSWRNVCVSRGNVTCQTTTTAPPVVSTTVEPTSTAAATSTITP